MIPFPTRAYAFLFVLLLLANINLYRTILVPEALTVEVLPAGKGHVVLLRTPDKRTVLVGAGSDASVLRALGRTLSPLQKGLDLLLLPGMGAAVAGGAPEALQRYRFRTLARPEVKGSWTLESALATALEHTPDTQTLFIKQEDRFALGGGVFVEILSYPGTVPANILLSYGRTSLFLYENEKAPSVPADILVTTKTKKSAYRSDGTTITQIK
jgi:hypothetical protein